MEVSTWLTSPTLGHGSQDFKSLARGNIHVLSKPKWRFIVESPSLLSFGQFVIKTKILLKGCKTFKVKDVNHISHVRYGIFSTRN